MTAESTPRPGTVRLAPRPGSIAAQARQGSIGTPGSDVRQRAAARFRRISDVLDARAVFPVFQPLVRADNRALVGYEAFTRGPAGTPWESPRALFAAANEVGRGAELDWACRASIGRAAIAAGLDASTALFVNADPSAVGTSCPDDLRPAIVESARRLSILVDLPERVVASNPAALLTAATAYRDAGCGIALDDVGTEPAALALLPLLDPDVVKLAPTVIRDPEARTVNAVLAHAESSRATVVAEGVETAEHLATARALGATVVQGYLTGRPGPLPGTNLPSLPPDALRRPFKLRPAGTPFELLSARQPVRQADLATLMTLSHRLEEAALDAAEPPVVLTCLPAERCHAEDTGTRLAQLAGSAALVIAAGESLEGAQLQIGDPLRKEWNVVVLGPHFAAALVARREDADRYDYVLTYQRSLVLHAAYAMMRCLTP